MSDGWSRDTWIRHLETMAWQVIQRVSKPTAAQRARIVDVVVLLTRALNREDGSDPGAEAGAIPAARSITRGRS